MRDISKGYIALYRQFLTWEWFTDIKTCHLFLYCLLRANNKNTVWRGINIRKGQFITSLRTMSIDTGLSFQEVRTALKKLTQNSTQELTQQSYASYSIITVVNYEAYQKSNTVCNTKFNKGATTDNNTNSNTSYINSSSSSSIEEKILNLTEDEEEILKTISKRNGVKYFRRWLKKVVENNDHIELIKEERLKQAKKEEKKKQLEAEEIPVITQEEDKKIREIQKKFKEKMRDDRRKKRFNQ